MNDKLNLNAATTRNSIEQLALALAASALLATGLQLHAAPLSWANPGTSGDFHVNTNWNPVQAPVNGDSLTLGAGDYTVTRTSGATQFADFAIGAGVVLDWRGDLIQQNSTGIYTNAGTIRFTANGQLRNWFSSAPSSPYQLANSGIIEVANGATLAWTQRFTTMDNSNGTIRALAGSTIIFNPQGGSGDQTITNGTIASAANSTLHLTGVNNIWTLSGVALQNAGAITYNVSDSTSGSNSMPLSFTFTNSASLNNLGTVTVENNAPTHRTGGATFERPTDARMIFQAGSTFNNTGTVTVLNSSDNNYGARQPTARITSVDSVVNQGNLNIWHTGDNLGNAYFQVSGAGNSFTQTNGGTINLAGGLQAYLQAPIVSITNGTLSGTGRVVGATTIAANGIVAPGNSIGTLTFTGSLTMADGATYNFEIADENSSDAIAVSGALSLGDIVLNFHVLDYAPTRTGLLDFTLFTFGGAAPTIGEWTINGLGNAWYGTPQVSVVGNAVVLGGIGIIPEPTSLALLALGGLAMLRRRRR